MGIPLVGSDAEARRGRRTALVLELEDRLRTRSHEFKKQHLANVVWGAARLRLVRRPPCESRKSPRLRRDRARGDRDKAAFIEQVSSTICGRERSRLMLGAKCGTQ